MLRSIVDQLLSDEAIARFKRDDRDLLQAQRKESKLERPVRSKRAKELRDEVENLTDAIARGALRTTAALAERLARAEAGLGEAERELVVDDEKVTKIVPLVPKVAERYCRAVSDLPHTLAGNALEARHAIGELLGGEVNQVPDEKAGKQAAHVGLNEYALAATCLETRAYKSNGSGGASTDHVSYRVSLG